MQIAILIALIIVGLLVIFGIGYLVYNYLHHHPMRDTIQDLHNNLNMEHIHNINHGAYHDTDGENY